MNTLLSNFKISVNPDIYLKDPESSELGRKIINHSIALIDELGFEQFTFKKLGVRIASNESSIYRYFENKHMLLKGEERKFELGESSLFVINSREAKLIESQVKDIVLENELLGAKSELYKIRSLTF